MLNYDKPSLPKIKWAEDQISPVQLFEKTYLSGKEWANFQVNREMPINNQDGHRWCWLSNEDTGTKDFITKKHVSRNPPIDEFCYIKLDKKLSMNELKKKLKRNVIRHLARSGGVKRLSGSKHSTLYCTGCAVLSRGARRLALDPRLSCNSQNRQPGRKCAEDCCSAPTDTHICIDGVGRHVRC